MDLSFLNLPTELAKDRGLTVVEYGTQKAALDLSNAAWMLMVEKIEQAHMLMEAPINGAQNSIFEYILSYFNIFR